MTVQLLFGGSPPYELTEKHPRPSDWKLKILNHGCCLHQGVKCDKDIAKLHGSSDTAVQDESSKGERRRSVDHNDARLGCV